MIDLIRSGLPLQFDEESRMMNFIGSLVPVEPDVRRLSRSRDFYRDPWAVGPEELYFMYRGISQLWDVPLFEGQELRYDITVVFPGKIGQECLRTIGHCHPVCPASGRGLTFPEVYEVLAGVATYYLQRMAPDGSVADVAVMEAHPGEKCLIPPGYGHITINARREVLVMANLIERNFASRYQDFQEKRGPAYYGEYSTKGIRFVPNGNYGVVPPLRRIQPSEDQAAGITFGAPLYEAFLRSSDTFRYLVNPDQYPQDWKEVLANP
jgi:glucose-6-phosphate isomerase